MAKASRVLAALKRDGWAETRRSAAMARIAKDYGYSLDELRKL